MRRKTDYLPSYRQSWALLIGVNDYRELPPLAYARNDAEGFGSILVNSLDFLQDNVTMLLDAKATRQGIMSAFMRFTTDCVADDDRLVIFFAGHGHTEIGYRGEIGYLVPADGVLGDLATLIRWDDLTRNADLIAAKHVLFVMDACYDGLAASRALPRGSNTRGSKKVP